MPKKLILLIGAPGSGKTTDAKRIASKHEGIITALSTGELIKNEIKEGTAVGRIALDFVSKGNLVPTGIIVDTIVTAVNAAPTRVVMLDGFPRKEKQLQYFGDYLYSHDSIDLISVIEVRVSDETAKERFLATHDSEATFEHSMKHYKDALRDIEKYYENQHVLKIIDGERDIETVVAEIDTYLESICTEF